MQQGRVYRKGNKWMFQYWRTDIENGNTVKRRVACSLGDYHSRDCNTESKARTKWADEIQRELAPTKRPESTQPIAEFLEYVYLPFCLVDKRPSTYKSYADLFKVIKPHLNGLALRDTRTSDIDRIMGAVAADKKRAHTTHRNMKSFLSGAFRFAKRKDLIADNPVRDSVVPRGKPAGDAPAYALAEIQAILAVLPEPARTCVLVAGLTGLRKSEIKGLRWDDFRGNEFLVQRSVWGRHVLDTKTLTSRAAVPMLPLVRKALEGHRKRNPKGKGFIFEGATKQPLRLENVVRRDIRPVLEKAGLPWLGWHAFRRGLGTNLNALGADGKTIQAILRHAAITTTMAFYVKPVAAESHAAMKKLEAAFKKSAQRKRK